MARAFNRSIRPVNSLKHIIDTATVAVPAGVVSTVILAESVDNPNLADVTEVVSGAVINSIYLRVESIHNSGEWVTIPRVYMIVVKNPGNEIVPPYPANAGSSDAKRFIIHQEMLMQTGINADANSFPRTMFNGVIKIPRGYRRFGYADRLTVGFALDVAETTATVSVCSQCIYKEYK